MLFHVTFALSALPSLLPSHPLLNSFNFMNYKIKSLLYFVGGTIFALLYKANQRSYLRKEQIATSLKAIPLLDVADAIRLSPANNDSVFISGRVAATAQTFKSLKQDQPCVFIHRSKYSIIDKFADGKRTRDYVSKSKGEKRQFASEFALVSLNDAACSLQIQDFQGTFLIPSVLQKFQKDKIYDKKKETVTLREPKDDNEMQRKLSGDTDFLKVFTWTIGVRIKEISLADGTTVCVFGSLLGSKDRITRMIGPKYIAKSKDEILDYLISDITFGKFLGILLFIGGGVCLYQFLRSLIKRSQEPRSGQKGL